MVKLYRTRGGVTEYWEAWFTATEVTIHWGKLGQEGESREIPFEDGIHPSEIIKREAKPLHADGFRALKPNALRSLIIQYAIEGRGTSSDHSRRVRVEELMNECLGWSGLGHCDGGDIGSGQMNVFCFVVDTSVAKVVIVRSLRENGLLDGAVIAERKEEETTVLWPNNFAGAFAVI